MGRQADAAAKVCWYDDSAWLEAKKGSPVHSAPGMVPCEDLFKEFKKSNKKTIIERRVFERMILNHGILQVQFQVLSQIAVLTVICFTSASYQRMDHVYQAFGI